MWSSSSFGNSRRYNYSPSTVLSLESLGDTSIDLYMAIYLMNQSLANVDLTCLLENGSGSSNGNAGGTGISLPQLEQKILSESSVLNRYAMNMSNSGAMASLFRYLLESLLHAQQVAQQQQQQ